MQRMMARMVEWLGGHELVVMLGTLAVVVSTWAFLAIASQVTRGRTHDFDDRVLLALRVPGDLSKPIGPDWMAETARDVTALGSSVILGFVTIAVVGFLVLDRRYAASLFVMVATMGGLALSMVLKARFDRPRPDLVPHLMRAYFSSFPSGHSMMSAVVYGTLGGILTTLVIRRRLKFYFMGLAATLAGLVGVSRVYLGVHYPTDVLAGWSAGLAWAMFCWLLGRQLKRTGTIEPTA